VSAVLSALSVSHLGGVAVRIGANLSIDEYIDILYKPRRRYPMLNYNGRIDFELDASCEEKAAQEDHSPNRDESKW
jgi:hypothetical protein